LNDVFNRLVEWVAANPRSVVSYGLGMVTFVLLYWLVRRPLSRKVDRLTGENQEQREAKGILDVKFQGARLQYDNLKSTQQRLADEADELRRATAKLETRLEALASSHQELHAAHGSATQENAALRDAKVRLETRLEGASAENQDLRDARRRLTAQNDDLHQRHASLQSALEKLLAEREALQEKLTHLHEELEAARESETELGQQVSELTEQVQRLAAFDGKVWDKPCTAVPPFLARHQRRVPIIAVANLKGGVGKTTLTANLGAILARQNHRVLLVDLDYQGSLTSLCLPAGEIQEIRRNGRFVDRLFSELPATPEAVAACSYPVAQLSGARLLAADEPLADVETRVMAQWLLQPEGGDVRYLLRSALHSRSLAEEYDYVLIDCPPRMTTACINAFTAADFLLIPVLLDRTSAEAVPRQLASLRQLKRVICPDLKLLGIIANRTQQYQQRLIARETRVWEALPDTCQDRWGEPVYHFATLIRQHRAFAEAAGTNGFAALDREVQPMFLDFAKELKARIAKHERQGPSAVSPQSPAAT
jgi:chromosome partitioning protein